MEPSYSVVADALSKFHAAPEWIQALWLVSVPATVLGFTGLVMRGLKEIVPALSHRRERGLLVYGVYQDRQGRWMVYWHGGKPKPVNWTDPPPEMTGQGQVIQGVFGKPEE